MKNFKIAGMVAAVVMAAAASSAASAANYIEISGEHADFYYDADLYGVGTATVVGDSITFALPSDYSASATAKTGSDSGRESITDDFAKGLIAVAHSGYQLNASLAASATVEFINTGGTSTGSVQGTYYVYKGSYLNGAVTQSSQLFIGSSAYFYYTASTPGTVEKTSSSLVSSGSGLYSTLIVDDGYYYAAGQKGTGTASTNITAVTYIFSAVTNGTPPITPVPEPETYAMLLAGLGLMGVLARRRKHG